MTSKNQQYDLQNQQYDLQNQQYNLQNPQYDLQNEQYNLQNQQYDLQTSSSPQKSREKNPEIPNGTDDRCSRIAQGVNVSLGG